MCRPFLTVSAVAMCKEPCQDRAGSSQPLEHSTRALSLCAEDAAWAEQGRQQPMMPVWCPLLVCLVMYRGSRPQLCLWQALCLLPLEDAEDTAVQSGGCPAIGECNIDPHLKCLSFACAEDEAWAERAAAEAVQRAAEEWPGGPQTAAISLSKKARKAARAQATAAAAAEGPHGVGRVPTLQQAQPAGAATPKQVAIEAGTGSKRKHKCGLLDQMRARLSGGQFPCAERAAVHAARGRGLRTHAGRPRAV